MLIYQYFVQIYNKQAREKNQGPQVGLILALACLPPALHLLEKNIAKNIFFKLVQTEFFMVAISYTRLQWVNLFSTSMQSGHML